MFTNPFLWIAAAFISYGLFIAWPDQAVCIARDKLFKLRTNLFVAAMRGQKGFSFDDPMYQEARETLNGLIRYSHKFDLASAVIGSIHAKKLSRDVNKSILVQPTDMSSEDDSRRATEYNRFILKALLTMMVLMVFRQPLLLPVWFVFFVSNRLRSLKRGNDRSKSSFAKSAMTRAERKVSASLAWGLRSSEMH